jgi:hypothetical protein
MLNSFTSFYSVLLEEFNGADLLHHDDDFHVIAQPGLRNGRQQFMIQ